MRITIALALCLACSTALADDARVTEAQIAALDRLIQLTPSSDPHRPDLVLRQAELYIQLARASTEPKRSQLRLAAIKDLCSLGAQKPCRD
jgi:hypothetical protein